MDREKEISKMADDLCDCYTEFVTDTGEIYTDYEVTSQKMFDKGYRKQSEVVKEIFEEIDVILAAHKISHSENLFDDKLTDEITELKKKYTEVKKNDLSCMWSKNKSY